MGKRLYIAYGSNLNLEQMAHRCPTAKPVGTAFLEEYELLFRGQQGCAVATVERKNGGTVPVLVWELQPADELALDRYEGCPFLYRKKTVEVKLNGQLIRAMVYIMNHGRQLGSPGDYYYEVIREGYLSAGFDTALLDDAVERSENFTMDGREEMGLGRTRRESWQGENGMQASDVPEEK